MDLDLAGLRLLGHRNGDGEHAGVVGGVEPIGIERVAEHDLADNRTLRSLLREHLDTVAGLPRAFGADGQDVALDLHVEGIELDAGEIEAELDLLVVAERVHRHPLPARGLAVDVAEGVVTNEHGCKPPGVVWGNGQQVARNGLFPE